MKYGLTFALVLTALCAASVLAEARPPTVMNSPGYDARLQESRKALGNPPTALIPAAPPATISKKSKKKHAN